MRAVIIEHPMLDREILFKSVYGWISDGLRGRGFGEIVRAERADGGGDEVVEYPRIELAGRELRITDNSELALARKALQREVNLGFMERGADVLDIESAFIHPDTGIGDGTVIYPHVVILNGVRIGSYCRIGPFAYLRPGTVVGDGAKIGDFVELKNSTIGHKTSVGHLTYIGDADIGGRVNVGCGTVTVNYDGVKKHRTTVKDGAFIGCNTNLVAPVTVGENAYTAAGSTITDEVPKEALAIARARQVNKEGWLSPKGRTE